MRWLSRGAARRKRVQIAVDRTLNKKARKKAWARFVELPEHVEQNTKEVEEMAKSVTGYGVIRAGGTVIISHRAQFDARISETFTEGEPVCVTVEKSTRTLAQNRLLWRMNNNIGRQAGLTKEEVHAASVLALNQKHATYLDKTSGELVDLVFGGSTHDMSITAMQEYMDRYIRYWAMRGYDAMSGPQPENDEEYGEARASAGSVDWQTDNSRTT